MQRRQKTVEKIEELEQEIQLAQWSQDLPRAQSLEKVRRDLCKRLPALRRADLSEVEFTTSPWEKEL